MEVEADVRDPGVVLGTVTTAHPEDPTDQDLDPGPKDPDLARGGQEAGIVGQGTMTPKSTAETGQRIKTGLPVARMKVSSS